MHFNIADLFESVCDAVPERDACVSGSTRLSFAALEARANRLAHALEARGLGPNDHVGLHLYNGHQFVEAMIACFKIRAVPININYRYVEHELQYLCTNADLKAVVTQREFLPLVAAVAPGVPTLHTILAVDDGTGAAIPAAGPDVLDYETALRYAAPHRRFGARSGDDYYVIYTGGTTGMPRGVMWRQEDVFFSALQGGAPGGDPITTPEELAPIAASGDRLMAIIPAAPFIHGAAQFSAWIALFTGGKVVLSPGRSFDADRIARLIEEERVTTITIVGDAMALPLAGALERAVPPVDSSSLMAVASAGAVLSASVKERLQAQLPSTLILNNFGASETGHQGSAFPTGDGETKRLSFFMDDSNTVIGEDLRPLAPGSGLVGRLARRGRVPLAYYKDPEKSAQTFLTIGGERWVVLRDLATVELDGMITIFGREDACINTGGEKVFCEEVEEALKSHPAVHDAVVIGLPDERWGNRVTAVVSPRDGTTPTLADLDQHCRALLAGYKVPRELHVVAAIHRQPSGKPDYPWAKRIAQGK